MSTTTPTHPAVLSAYTPKPQSVKVVEAVQFLGVADPGPAPTATNPHSVRTFLGYPVREEPFRHDQAHYEAAPAGAVQLAVLVPTHLGGVPAFPGDWIVSDAVGVLSVWPDSKFRGGFDTKGGGAIPPSTIPGVAPAPAPAPAPGPDPTPTPTPVPVFITGSSFRIRRADQTIDPVIHVATTIAGVTVSYVQDGATLEVNRDHIVPVGLME